jgi:hypothetical protein
LPPLEYDYPYEGKLVITRADQFMIDRACPKPTRQGTKILGCAYLGKNENGEDQCWLIIANDKIIEGWHWVYETVFRHEQGHCNGWPNDHPNARSKMAPPGSKPVNMTVRPSEADLEKEKEKRQSEADIEKWKERDRQGEEKYKQRQSERTITTEGNDRLSLECVGFKTVPIEPVDRDPVVKSSIHLYKPSDEKKPTGFEVKHETLTGKTYARNDQYRDLRFWSDRNGDYWSGVSVKNRQRTMVGQLGYDPTGRGISARRYIEKSFIAGRLEQTTTSTCTCAASATEKASEQCSGAEPSGALRQ